MTRLRNVLTAPLVALLAMGALLGASAVPTEGSVPSEVAAFVSNGSLVAQLNDVYGLDASGGGIDFGETTTTGTIERVHHFSDEFRAGEDTEYPFVLVNEWIVPILIDEEPVGVATIWINQESVLPELAGFVADADLAGALSEVPDGESLVHDAVSVAWLSLADDGTLTPLVPGTTGLSTPVPIDDIALLPTEPLPPTPEGDPATGVAFASAVILFLFAIIVVALLVPNLRKKKKKDRVDAGEPAELEAAGEPETPPEAEEPTEEEAPAEPEQSAEPVDDAESDEAKPKKTPKTAPKKATKTAPKKAAKPKA